VAFLYPASELQATADRTKTIKNIFFIAFYFPANVSK
jgi:hypothetical protein